MKVIDTTLTDYLRRKSSGLEHEFQDENCEVVLVVTQPDFDVASINIYAPKGVASPASSIACFGAAYKKWLDAVAESKKTVTSIGRKLKKIGCDWRRYGGDALNFPVSVHAPRTQLVSRLGSKAVMGWMAPLRFVDGFVAILHSTSGIRADWMVEESVALSQNDVKSLVDDIYLHDQAAAFAHLLYIERAANIHAKSGCAVSCNGKDSFSRGYADGIKRSIGALETIENIATERELVAIKKVFGFLFSGVAPADFVSFFYDAVSDEDVHRLNVLRLKFANAVQFPLLCEAFFADKNLRLDKWYRIAYRGKPSLWGEIEDLILEQKKISRKKFPWIFNDPLKLLDWPMP